MSLRSCDVQRVSPDTTEFVYRDHVAAADLRAMVNKYKKLREQNGPEQFNLVDTLAVTGVDKELGAILAEVLELFRSGGGKHVIMVATEDFVQMLGRSMSFGSGTKLHLAHDRKAGQAKLAELRAAAG